MNTVRFNVPSKFVALLKSFEKELQASSVIEALEWATKRPEEAEKIAEHISKSGHLTRKRFEINMRIGLDPEHAFELTVQRQAEISKQRSFLGKVIAGARKGGFKFTMPNGAACVVKYDPNSEHYRFIFNLNGAEITVIAKRATCHLIYSIAEGHVPSYYVRAILYKGKTYSATSKQGEAILKAIEENISPEILMVADL